jgi:hypothetical protein
MAAGTRIVEVEAQVEVVGNVPARVETDRVQIVSVFAMLLFVTEVLAGARELMEQDGRGNGLAGVELETVEAVTLQPDGLLAAIFRELVESVRVVEGQRDVLA